MPSSPALGLRCTPSRCIPVPGTPNGRASRRTTNGSAAATRASRWALRTLGSRARSRPLPRNPMATASRPSRSWSWYPPRRRRPVRGRQRRCRRTPEDTSSPCCGSSAISTRANGCASSSSRGPLVHQDVRTVAALPGSSRLLVPSLGTISSLVRIASTAVPNEKS